MLHAAGMEVTVPAPARRFRARRRLVVHALGGPLLGLVVAAAGLLGPGAATAASALVTNRVVGGAAVPAISSFPYQAALYIRSGGGMFGQLATLAFCGGVVVDPTQIVTAAHCVTDDATGQVVNPALVTALVGTATLPQGVPPAPAAAAIAIDPSYNPRTADYDVAVVTLTTPLYSGAPRADGTAAVAPIPLITPALAAAYADPNVSPSAPVTISGWGETAGLAIGASDQSPNLPQQLQAAQTHLVADRTCAAEYSALGSIGVPSITPQMLCAGEAAGGVDACSGDSGGPLVVDINTPATPPSDYVLAGLIDFGAGCAQPGYPGVYVRVATPQITGFIAQQAQAAGQLLTPAPPPVGVAPTRQSISGAAKATLATTTARVRRRLAAVRVRCATATCTGSLTLRTTTTVGIAHFQIAASSTATVPVRITPHGQKQLDAHGHRLRTVALLRTSGSSATKRSFTISD
jgi:secreted trypsin-like serine protease